MAGPCHSFDMASPDVRVLTDPRREAWGTGGPRPVVTYVWSAAAATTGGTVLLSHGTGGCALDLSWLAEPLASAGLRVIGVDHHGNSHRGGYHAEAFARWWDRPQDLSVVLDHLADGGPVGVAGFSLGGYTAAAMLGARIDADVFGAIATRRVTVPSPPEYPTLIDELSDRIGADDIAVWISESGEDYADRRVTAGLLICPAQGQLLTSTSLRGITTPVSIWWTGEDDQTPAETNALHYASLIPGATEHCADPSAGHYVFVRDTPGADRVRSRLASAAVAFFREQLTA